MGDQTGGGSTAEGEGCPDENDAGGKPAPGGMTSARTWRPALRFSSSKLLVMLLLYIFTAPFVDQLREGALITSLLMTAVLIIATLSVGSRRWTLMVAVFLVVPTLVARWSVHVRGEPIPPEVFSISGMLFIGFVALNIVHFTIRAPEVGSEVLYAGITGYLLIGIFWAFAYRLVDAATSGAYSFNGPPTVPHSMQGFNAIYFSYTTLCTLGYGDIAPVSPAARMTAIMEAMTGTLYVTVMIARLVALHTSRIDHKG
jgi:hypothetical protein